MYESSKDFFVAKEIIQNRKFPFTIHIVCNSHFIFLFNLVGFSFNVVFLSMSTRISRYLSYCTSVYIINLNTKNC